MHSIKYSGTMNVEKQNNVSIYQDLDIKYAYLIINMKVFILKYI